jgi:hypothetical protein
MRNFTVHQGSATRFLCGPAHARPRSPPRPLIGRPHLSATPPPDTVPRPACQFPTLCFQPATPARAALGPLPSAARRLGPGPMTPPRTAWHSHGRTPPLPPFSPLSAPPTDRFKTRPKCRPLLHHPHLSDPPLERHTIPHRFPCLDHPLRPPEAPPSLGFWPSAATVCHSPVSSSPSLQSSQFLAISSHPCPSRAAGSHRTQPRPPELPPYRRTPPSRSLAGALGVNLAAG